jgi:hypothetical protein
LQFYLARQAVFGTPTPVVRATISRRVANVEQTRDDLEAHLRRLTARLRAAVAAFERGDSDQAAIMAVTLRLLLHDTSSGSSKSLLGQLELLDRIAFSDTRVPGVDKWLSTPQEGVGFAGFVVSLAALRIGADVKYEANLDRFGSKDQGFGDWWNGLVLKVRHPSEQRAVTFSRRALVLTVASKDGGAHVDGMLEETYYTLTRGNLMGELTINGKPVSWDADPVPTHIRQMAHEVLGSLHKAGLA